MSGSSREAFRITGSGREWSGDPDECPGVVEKPSQMFGRPSRMSGCVRKALPDVQEWLGGPPRCPGVVGRPFRMSGCGRRPSWMSGSSREALPNVWEWTGGLLNDRECLGNSPGCPGVLPDVREWSKCYPECLGVVRRPSWISGSGRNAILNVRELSEGPSDCPRVF